MTQNAWIDNDNDNNYNDDDKQTSLAGIATLKDTS